MADLDYHLMQIAGMILPYDIFRKIILLVYEPVVEDVSNDSCCVKHTDCNQVFSHDFYHAYPDNTERALSGCKWKHKSAGIVKIKTLNQEMTFFVPKQFLCFNCFSKTRNNINELSPYTRGFGYAQLALTDKIIATDINDLQDNVFSFNPDEIPTIKDKLLKILLNMQEICFRSYIK